MLRCGKPFPRVTQQYKLHGTIFFFILLYFPTKSHIFTKFRMLFRTIRLTTHFLISKVCGGMVYFLHNLYHCAMQMIISNIGNVVMSSSQACSPCSCVASFVQNEAQFIMPALLPLDKCWRIFKDNL